jgi:pyruvate formate lyase activating enzyme
MTEALIFDVKRYAINDGPGIRIVIFFKGCNLNCVWCHNPEGISSQTERMYAPAKCIKCGTCVIACPQMALSLTPEGIVTDAELCKRCFRCADVCPTRAIEFSGKPLSISQIMDEIEKERIFFDQSGGGVTFSGGEPIFHAGFLIELLDQCGLRGIHRAVDTAGLSTTSVLLEVAKKTDLFLYDLKMINSDRHQRWTGMPNKKILENLKALSQSGAKIIIRIPLIGGVNDDVLNITETARFISMLAGEPKTVNLLPYHKIAQNKYDKLGRRGEFRLLNEPTKEAQLRAIAIFREFEIEASIGG